MLHYLLMCRSLTYAQRAAKALERGGITAVVSKAPKSASPQGCTYCVRISQPKLPQALSILKVAGLGPSRILLESADKSFREVKDLD